MNEFEERYSRLAVELINYHDGVTEADGVLFVHGLPFGRLVDQSLSVRLPVDRVTDLQQRGIIRGHQGDWVFVTDETLWTEMARESHEYVGEPPVGRQS
jgi:hypothetical protein